MLLGWGSWQALVTPEKPLPIRLFWKGCKPVPSQILLKDYLIYVTILPRSLVTNNYYYSVILFGRLAASGFLPERMGPGTGDTMSMMRSMNSLGCSQAQKCRRTVSEI